MAGPANARHRGYLLFGRDGGLVAQAFDSQALRINGEAAPIAVRLGTVHGRNLSYRRRNFTASATGLLIYDAHSDRQLSQLRWVDRDGKPLNILAQLDNVGVPFLSPDESRILVARKDLATNDNDLWLTDTGKNPVRFTFDPGSDLLGLWSPDGQRIVWSSTRNGSFDLYEKEVSSEGQDTLLLRSAEPKFPLDWSRDDVTCYIARLVHKRATISSSCQPAVNPNRSHISTRRRLKTAVRSPRTGTGLPTVRMNRDASKCTWRVSRRTAANGRFHSPAGVHRAGVPTDGRELYYHSLDGRLMAVALTRDGATLTTGTPRALFAFRPASTDDRSILRRHARRPALSAECDCRDRPQGGVVSRADLARRAEAARSHALTSARENR